MPRGQPLVATLEPQHHDDDQVDGELVEHLRRVVQHAEVELPALPRVAQRALALLQDPDVDYRQLGEAVRTDQALAARMLRLVNSAAFARMFKVERIEAAFARLGRRTLQSVILAMSLKGLALEKSGVEGALGQDLWRHSICCAAVVGAASRRYGLPENDAFLAGLLHDIGKLAVLRVVHAYQESYGQKVPRVLYQRLCDEWHEPLGRQLAANWRLQHPLPDIIGNHHATVTADDPLATCRALVQLAIVTSALLGYSPYVPYDFFNLPCMQVLGLADKPASHAWLATLPATIIDQTGMF